jgi:hypothetical protein
VTSTQEALLTSQISRAPERSDAVINAPLVNGLEAYRVAGYNQYQSSPAGARGLGFFWVDTYSKRGLYRVLLVNWENQGNENELTGDSGK